MHPDDKDNHKVRKDQMLNAISTWAKINDIDLNKLSRETHINQRKGEIKNALLDEYDVDKTRFTVGDDRPRGFAGIELSDSGEKLLGLDIE
jgi:hypothetical protein